MLNSLVRVSRRVEWNEAQTPHRKMKVGEIHPVKGGPTHKCSSRLPECQLQSGAAPGHRQVGGRRRQVVGKPPAPSQALGWPPTSCGGEREESRPSTRHSPTRVRSPRKGNVTQRQQGTRRTQSTPDPRPVPSVYLQTISRTLELSLQSSFQLSLTVLVRYRSRMHI